MNNLRVLFTPTKWYFHNLFLCVHIFNFAKVFVGHFLRCVRKTAVLYYNSTFKSFILISNNSKDVSYNLNLWNEWLKDGVLYRLLWIHYKELSIIHNITNSVSFEIIVCRLIISV